VRRTVHWLGAIVLIAILAAPQARTVTTLAADTPEARVACAMNRLDLRAKVGQIMMVAVAGDQPTRHMANILRTWQPGGIVLFSRNVGTAADLRALIASAQQVAPLPLLVATDQEGGPVTRIRVGLTPLAAPSIYGQLGSSTRVYDDTRAQGLALRALGINLDLAPVVDVKSVPDSAIGRRSFGPNPQLDAELAAAAIRGYQAAGIGATAKHFLGLGSVKANADLSLPVVKATRAQLESGPLVVMRAAVQADVAAMMITRVVIPALDPSGTTAYASSAMINNVVRGELGYTGMLLTDSLLTQAILQGPGSNVAATAALQAGDDMLLLGTGEAMNEPEITQAIDAVGEAVALNRIPLSRLDDAVLHVLRLKARLNLLPAC
jgi:beta-N-acetylhexosaminidase